MPESTPRKRLGRFARAVEKSLNREKAEREDPRLLLERAEQKLQEIRDELESRQSYKFEKFEPGGWADRSAWDYLDAAKAAVERGDMHAAAVETFFLGQAIARLEAPIVDNVKQRSRPAGKRGKSKPITQLLQRLCAMGYQDLEQMLEALEGDAAQDAAEQEYDPIPVLIQEVAREERRVYYLSRGAENSMSFKTLGDHIRKSSKTHSG
ncbi:hypothetical protein [Algiphilus aromaticivorans]|uniref:hypothetical protein n=1 Tax=Algiphilus aromaticivorans TaxID=382454 RepID=UPI0005C1F1D2|nr:hypothetical protein [Algiphilus aromaticivorans]